MNANKRNSANNKVGQNDSKQKSNNKKQLQPENDFQIFFKLEFDSLNNFASQQMFQLKEEIESELLQSKSLLNKYRHLRQICDKKKEFDQFKRWNDYNSHHHSKAHDTIDEYEYEYKKPRSMSQHHRSHSELRHSSSHGKSYYYDDYRHRKVSPEYDERIRHHDSRMMRDLPSSQRKRTVKRTYHDDLERISRFKAQNSHKIRNPSHRIHENP